MKFILYYWFGVMFTWLQIGAWRYDPSRYDNARRIRLSIVSSLIWPVFWGLAVYKLVKRISKKS